MRPDLPRGVLLLCLFLFAPSSHVFAEKITDSDLGFTLQLSPEFVPRPDLVGATPKIVHAFQFGDVAEGELPIILFIESMNGTIGRERLRQEDMPANSKAVLFITKWQGFEVDGFEIIESDEGKEGVTFNVQIPLKRKAIQVKLFGPIGRKEEVAALLQEVLGGLKGDSNWFASIAPTSISGYPYYGMILVGVGFCGVLVGLIVLAVISRKCPQGTVLAIAAIVYFVGSQIDGTRVRELMLLSGGMRLFGIAAGILGIIDLIRKRKPQPNVATLNPNPTAVAPEATAPRE
jgi:hypothetical protein